MDVVRKETDKQTNSKGNKNRLWEGPDFGLKKNLKTVFIEYLINILANYLNKM